MIKNNAIGYEQQVKDLLSKSILNMDKKQIDAWMKNQFDASCMYIHIDDEIVTSCLQMQKKVLKYKNQKCTVSAYTMACTLPDYRQRGYFSELLDAALNQSANNDLLSMVYTTFPKLFESRSFSPISKTYNYWISPNYCDKGNDRNIKTYSPSMDLYSIYQSFLNYFDGTIQHTEDEFEQLIQYHLNSGKKIVVMTKNDEITGFAIYKVINLNVQIDTIVYLNSQAIIDVFKYFGYRYFGISFTISEYERFDKILNIDFPRTNGTVMARCNNYKLFSKWCGNDVRNASQIFDALDIPSWNHFM